MVPSLLAAVVSGTDFRSKFPNNFETSKRKHAVVTHTSEDHDLDILKI